MPATLPAPASASNCSLHYSVAGKRHQAGEVQPSLQLGFPYTGKIAGEGADLCSSMQWGTGTAYLGYLLWLWLPARVSPSLPPFCCRSLLLLLACIFVPSTRDEIAGLTAQVAVPMHVNSI